MAATQLGLYNGALRILGEERLVDLNEDHEKKRVLDGIWDDGLINNCLEQGLWNFATRTIMLDYDTGISPDFGYRRAFEEPSDCIRLASISVDEYFSFPLLQYRPEGGFWWCDHDRIYVSYISNDSQYGADLSLWPESFKRYVEYYMALMACERFTQGYAKYADLFKITERKLVDARSKDAMAQPVSFPPQGRWVSARRRGSFGRRGTSTVGGYN